MTVREVYAKYKHLDELLSDPRMLHGAGFKYQMLYDCWGAIKEQSKPSEYIYQPEPQPFLFEP